ncbi:LemA family protein [Methyloceanibacter sp.]|uniref:LemA family protein n=1 Tax=Methyloceanibacter sp. TaxID=1965321 RepID=UPI003D6D43AB
MSTLRKRSIAYFSQGLYDRAISDADEMVRLEPDSSSYDWRAALYDAKGEHDRAIADSDQAIALATAPNSPYLESNYYFYIYRADAFAHKGEFERALGDYERAAKLNPDAPMVDYHRGDALRVKGDLDGAIREYDVALRKAAKGDDSKLIMARALYGRGLSYEAKGDHDRAISDLDDAIVCFQHAAGWSEDIPAPAPAPAPAPYEDSSQIANGSEGFQAGKACAEGEQHNGSFAVALLARGSAYEAKSRASTAQSSVDQVDAYREKARVDFQETLSSPPVNLESVAVEMSDFDVTPVHEAARKRLAALDGKRPAPAPVAATSDAPAAQDGKTSPSAIEPTDPDECFNTVANSVRLAGGALHVNRDNFLGDPNRVIEACSRLESGSGGNSRGNEEIHASRALAYRIKGDYDRAIVEADGLLRDAANGREDLVDAYVFRGSIFLAKGDFDSALADSDKATARGADLTDRNNAAVHTLRGAVLLAKGDRDRALNEYQQAIAAYSKIIDRNPTDRESYLARGLAREASGDREGAKADFRLVLSRGPNDETSQATPLQHLAALENNEATPLPSNKAATDTGAPVPLPAVTAGSEVSQAVKSAWNEVLGQYQRRADLVPNLIETMKGYAASESKVLAEVIEARAKATQQQFSPDAPVEPDALKRVDDAQRPLSEALTRLFAVTKNYPDLTSNQNFVALQSQLEATDNRIAIARYDYIEANRQSKASETAKAEQPAPAPAQAPVEASATPSVPAPQSKPAEEAAAPVPAPAPQEKPPVVAKAEAPAAQPPAVSPRQSPTPAAEQSRRLALVVGNDAYENLPPLRKAVNDARAVGESLTKLGFEVSVLENASRRAMTTKLVEFAGRVTPGDTALFFYAGHGVTMGGTNYLIPADAPEMHEGQEALIAAEGVSADGVMQQIQGRGAKVVMLVLDACRDNPFAKAGGRGVGGTRGLTLMTVPEGVFVLYSAGIGETALDRLGDDDPNPNSVFTRTFVKLLGEQGLTVHDIAKRTQHDVYQLAKGASHTQMPAYYDQILGELTLLPGN